MEAAKHLKPCILELGGKAPAVVRITFACHASEEVTDGFTT